MAYMGNFDDLLTATQPVSITHISELTEANLILKLKTCFFLQQIDAVLSASLSVFRSARLKKIFEVCLKDCGS